MPDDDIDLLAIPSTGACSLQTIQTEFGGTNPISMSEYYAGGAYTPAGTKGNLGAIPTSGSISIGHFRGSSNIVTMPPAGSMPTFYRSSSTLSGTYTFNVGISDPSPRRVVAFSGSVANLAQGTMNITSLTINGQQMVGTNQIYTYHFLNNGVQGIRTWIAWAEIPTGTTATVTVTTSTSSIGSWVQAYPLYNLNSLTRVGAAGNGLRFPTSLAVTVPTEAGGVVIWAAQGGGSGSGSNPSGDRYFKASHTYNNYLDRAHRACYVNVADGNLTITDTSPSHPTTIACVSLR